MGWSSGDRARAQPAGSRVRIQGQRAQSQGRTRVVCWVLEQGLGQPAGNQGRTKGSMLGPGVGLGGGLMGPGAGFGGGLMGPRAGLRSGLLNPKSGVHGKLPCAPQGTA